MSSSFFFALVAAVATVIIGTTGGQLIPPGGLRNIDVNHKDIVEILHELPSMSNDLNGLEIVKVVKAQVQVVSGFRYVLTIQTRTKGSNGPASQECEASVWIQSWLEKRTLTSMKCKPVDVIPLTGGMSDIAINHKDVLEIVHALPSMSNDLNGLEIVKVVKAQMQVVAGFRYVVTIQTRTKGSNGPATQECEADVWIQSWLNKRTLTSMKCKPVAVTPFSGGMADIAINHKDVLEIVHALPSMSNDLNGLEIVKVVKAQVQVVAGLRYVLTIQTRTKGSNGPATKECVADVWVQAWLEKRTLTSMTCNAVVVPLLGGMSDIDVNHKDVLEIVHALPSMSNDLNGLEIVKVVKAQVQVVAGLRYVLTIQYRTKGSNGPATQECVADVWVQNWLNKRTLKSMTCNAVPATAPGLPGGLSNIDVTQEQVKEIVQALPSMSNDLNGLEIVKVVKAQAQVSAGFIYVLTIQIRNKGSNGSATQECVADVWVQNWMNKRTLRSMTCNAVPATAPGLPGGMSDIDVNHKDVLEIVHALPSMSNDLNGLEIVKVVKAQVQVVSGFRYVLTIQIRNKGSNGPATQECVADVWVQSWLNKRTLNSMKCNAVPATPTGLPGGWHDALVTDLVKKSANIGLEVINSACNCLYRKNIVVVKKVQEKIVSGVMQKITVELIASSCRNTEENQGKGLEVCPALENAVAKECDITMVYQPWLSPQFRLNEQTCH